MRSRGADFNRIKEWLEPKLAEMGISVETFSRMCGLSKASIYFYMADTTRPDEQSMAKICHALGVPLEEGLAQYTPKYKGRPRGTTGRTRSVSVRRN